MAAIVVGPPVAGDWTVDEVVNFVPARLRTGQVLLPAHGCARDMLEALLAEKGWKRSGFCGDGARGRSARLG